MTTRKGRDSDPDNYLTDVKVEDLLDLIERGEVLQYDITDDGKIYASTLDSIRDGIMIAPVLSTGVGQFLELVDDVVVTGIVASGKEWDTYLQDRRNDPRYLERIEEALVSLRYLQEKIHTIFIVENDKDLLEKPAQQIIAIMKEKNRHQFKTNLRRINRKINEMITIATHELRDVDTSSTVY